MVFSSIEFLWFFMPGVLLAYLAVPPRWRNALLASVSLVFYAWGAHAILLVFVASILVNYGAGRAIGRAQQAWRQHTARRVMQAAIVIDLAILFCWKYTVFAAEQLDRLVGFVGGGSIPEPSITLPIGISFFTFHAISYVVDVTRGQATPMRSIADYAQYMAFFPQLIAGPIIRYRQIEDPPWASRRRRSRTGGSPRLPGSRRGGTPSSRPPDS